MKMKRGWIAAVALCFVIWMGTLFGGFGEKQAAKGADRYDHVVQFPKERYPETGSHIQEAIRKGHSDVCTIDRNGADARRQESLKGIPTKPGFDRDEWPMAVCLEGGKGASVQYVSPSDNRGAGSWVGHQISEFPDGKRILFIVK
ncbi:sporulation protein [Bacillus sp. PAMC28571]|nr:sporulation protein [Bacillus sp. PAMC28571]QNK43597.1 sporulation protein [Bacillus sp. PAMC22265]